MEQNKELFSAFQEIHDKYVKDPKKWQDEFNKQGRKVLEIIRKFENRLCSRTESGMYGKYSASLSEKFRAEVRRRFPKIDFVGVKISDPFAEKLKQIQLD
ncbi:MAG: hypothetical protein HYU80_04305 [Candidatus Blackburnbacteria bacterium]|nr:hypothetical protein [Candidatus Blackburnbacteria bacterium]